uniref:Uncharacterized protein n=1 Tax=Setaria italica TaxID=4555 RepID=K3Z1L2_SETIT
MMVIGKKIIQMDIWKWNQQYAVQTIKHTKNNIDSGNLTYGFGIRM